MDKKILLWNPPHSPDQELSANFGEITGHKGAITSLRWMNNGLLATSSSDTTVGLWDTETGRRTRKFAGHSLVVNEVDQDQNLIASASDDGDVYIWDSNSRDPVTRFHTDFPLLTVAFHKNIVYASGIEPIIRAWDIRSPSSPVFEIETLHTDTITSLTVDDTNLVSRSNDDTVRIYEPKVIPGEHIRPAVYDGATSGNENFTIRAIIRENVILSGSADKTVTTWDVSSRKLMRKLTGHTGTVIDVDEHEGKIASSSIDGSVILRYTNA
ncbi:CYFA0S02e01002g1_1 [Cyberlindnera fabianii]|uniref:CYFA0S02e01002g1_1 n=1 Tax=Cyberlindnera fabianii TaxID=36022 RepID=A0A061AMK7_CYBFA|nr:CYFA0S02e01002g1_1 [Cyberlindnera fabianii]